MFCASILCPADLPPPSVRRVPRPSRGDGWNILADVEVFVFAVEAELEAMDRERVGVHRRGRKPDPSLRRRLIGLIWMLTFGGMRWRIAGWLSGVPFTTLHSSFARWTRLGLWRRLGQRLALDWRLACGDEVLPSAVVADSRALRRGGARARHPRRGLARRHAGRALPAERHPLGGRAAVRLVESLPAPQHRVRPCARPLRRACLDCDDLHHLTTARRRNPDAVRDLFAYSFLAVHGFGE